MGKPQPGFWPLGWPKAFRSEGVSRSAMVLEPSTRNVLQTAPQTHVRPVIGLANRLGGPALPMAAELSRSNVCSAASGNRILCLAECCRTEHLSGQKTQVGDGGVARHYLHEMNRCRVCTGPELPLALFVGLPPGRRRSIDSSGRKVANLTLDSLEGL